MSEDWSPLRTKLLATLRPSDKEVKALEVFIHRLESELTRLLTDSGFMGEARVHGSTARGTWISGDTDIDLFLVLDPKHGKGVLPRILDLLKGYLGNNWVEAYAEHPYLQAVVDGFAVDFVPCFRVDPSRGLVSSTDRTPLHTDFVRAHLPRGGSDEVLLLKQFMKGIGVYGAEMKVEGFSGYLCELMVIQYGSFMGVLERAAIWESGEVIDIFGEHDLDLLRKRYDDSLIVVDPVDSRRNVASALSLTSFSVFSAAAQAFLVSPDMRFFYPVKVDVASKDLNALIQGVPAEILFLVLDDGSVGVPDVLWGELYRSMKALTQELVRSGVKLIRSAVWSDEASRHVFVFMVESRIIPGVVKRSGPPVSRDVDSGRFLKVHNGSESTVSGPWVEGDRWVVLKRRVVTDVRKLLESSLIDGGRSIGISKKLGARVGTSYSVLSGEKVSEIYTPTFAQFLAEFIRGRPAWLD